MTDKQTTVQPGQGNAPKDPSDRATGDKPLPGSQTDRDTAVTPPMPRTPRPDEEGGAPVDELDLDGDGSRGE
jgi:hypothetical protein